MISVLAVVNDLLPHIFISSLHTFVARCNRIILIVRPLCTANDMALPASHLGSRRNTYHSAILMLDVFVARKRSISYRCNRVIGVWGANSLELALVGTVDGDLLEDGVCGGAGG
jgi:hypothetical protein